MQHNSVCCTYASLGSSSESPLMSPWKSTWSYRFLRESLSNFRSSSAIDGMSSFVKEDTLSLNHSVSLTVILLFLKTNQKPKIAFKTIKSNLFIRKKTPVTYASGFSDGAYLFLFTIFETIPTWQIYHGTCFSTVAAQKCSINSFCGNLNTCIYVVFL
jgi:hypothetical protein